MLLFVRVPCMLHAQMSSTRDASQSYQLMKRNDTVLRMQPRAETRREGDTVAGFNVLQSCSCHVDCRACFSICFTNRSSLFFFFFFARKAAVERDASEVSQKQHTVRAAAARALQ